MLYSCAAQGAPHNITTKKIKKPFKVVKKYLTSVDKVKENDTI